MNSCLKSKQVSSLLWWKSDVCENLTSTDKQTQDLRCQESYSLQFGKTEDNIVDVIGMWFWLLCKANITFLSYKSILWCPLLISQWRLWKKVTVWNAKLFLFPDNFELFSVFTSTLYILQCVCEHVHIFDLIHAFIEK